MKWLLLLFSIRVAEVPPDWERVVHLFSVSVARKLLSHFVCVLFSPLGIEVGFRV